MIIRRERPGDVEAVYGLVARAFDGHPHSDGSEPEIIRRLRSAGALSLALVAEENGVMIGHIAFSPVGIADGTDDWFGLGPLAVEPARQNRGIGTALVLGGLELMKDEGAMGVVLLGSPAFYGRFGFRNEKTLRMMGAPDGHFLALPFEDHIPHGLVSFHKAFSARD